MISANQYFDTLNFLLLMLIVASFLYTANNLNNINICKRSSSGIIFFLLVLPLSLFLGFRPISGAFGDMSNYEEYFSLLSSGKVSLFHGSDILFVKYIQLCTKIMDVKAWFFITTFITIVLQYWAIKRLFPTSVYILLLASVCSLTFYGSIVNGIRIGMAMSVFLIGLSFYKKQYWMFLIFLVSVGLHKSMILPSFASVLAIYYTNTKYYIYSWFLAVAISLASSSVLSDVFNWIGFIDVRLDSYLFSTVDPSKFSYTGFRYDFLTYSIVPILLGYYTQKRHNLEKYHQLYAFLLNTYIAANAFWVLIIEANYSNRFASLSWILWPFVTIYPILYISQNKYRNMMVLLIIFGELAVTYFIS
ncbi:MAG: EpsG family protein [Mangrovibacterium sp.]